MSDVQPRRVGLPWYSREDYPAILELMADRHNLAATYDLWLAAAQNNESVGQQAGLAIVRIMIEPESFSRWCKATGREPDGAARTAYASEQVSREAQEP